jgi:hypothetical protein
MALIAVATSVPMLGSVGIKIDRSQLQADNVPSLAVDSSEDSTRE